MTLLETQARYLIEERTTRERREPCGRSRYAVVEPVETTTYRTGSIDGAVRAGERAAREVLARAAVRVPSRRRRLGSPAWAPSPDWSTVA